MNPVIALSTCPDIETGQRIAEVLVTEHLATCVNRVEGVRSTYFWDGRLQDDSEILLIIKTLREVIEPLEARLKDLHPYELPELVVLGVESGSQAYLDWITAGVKIGPK